MCSASSRCLVRERGGCEEEPLGVQEKRTATSVLSRRSSFLRLWVSDASEDLVGIGSAAEPEEHDQNKECFGELLR